jgi:hypothetical protein
MVVVSRRTDFFGSTTTPLSAMGFVVGSGIGDDSGKEGLGSSVEAGRVESPLVKACVTPSLGTGIAVTPETSDDSFDTMDGRIDVGRGEVTTGTLVMSSSEADDDDDELDR